MPKIWQVGTSSEDITSTPLVFCVFSIWVCLKMLCTPLYPMVLLIIIPMKNGYFIGKYTLFSDKPICFFPIFLGMSVNRAPISHSVSDGGPPSRLALRKRLASVGRICLLHGRKESIDLHDVVQCLETQRELGMVRWSDSDSWFLYISKGHLRYFVQWYASLKHHCFGISWDRFPSKTPIVTGIRRGHTMAQEQDDYFQ